jgi:tRNA pseudouridine55 synthase
MILLADKPTWWTSHDLVKFIKVHGNYKKVWHAGTLDPLATWLMIILTDDDTKKMDSLVWRDKTYTATIDLTHKSDTWDSDYHDIYEEIIVEHKPTEEQIVAILQSFTPRSTLLLPSFSAKKIWGKRMYKSAREWVVHEVQKEMDIYSINLLEYAFPYVKISCHVWSWTFIRSIAYTLWERLWTWWIITALRRETIWEYSLTDPTCIKDLLAMKQKNLSNSTISSVDEHI